MTGFDLKLMEQKVEQLRAENARLKEELQNRIDEISDLHESLRQQQSEPVAWVQDVEEEMTPEFAFSWVKTQLHDVPLYLAPPAQSESERDAALRLAKEAIEFELKPTCLCFSGCPNCNPDPAPPTLYEVLVAIDAAMQEGKK